MFKNPFSFNGRIRRLEYGISYLLYVILSITVDQTLSIEANYTDLAIAIILLIPMLWFLWAQGAKRCHDRGSNGWWQVIPFYIFWMIFAEGDRRRNKYGSDPKFPDVPDWDGEEGRSDNVSVTPVDEVDGDGIIINTK